jgi:hypothetical protein
MKLCCTFVIREWVDWLDRKRRLQNGGIVLHVRVHNYELETGHGRWHVQFEKIISSLLDLNL